MERTESFRKRRGEKASQWQALAALVGGMCVALAIIGAGVGGLVTKMNPEGMPNFFIGVIAAGVLLLLLMIPSLASSRTKDRKKKISRNPGNTETRKVWCLTAQQVCADLMVSSSVGLSELEADDRYSQYGANEVVFHTDDLRFWSFFVKQIYEPSQLLLLCVGILYLMFGSLGEAITAFVVIILVALAGMGTEWRAKHALNNLQHSGPAAATVKREGQLVRLEAQSVVQGDIVILNEGMEVPADIRLIRASFLTLDESRITGSTSPVRKDPSRVLSEYTPLLDRCNIALAGSLVTGGRGFGVVYQTGISTYLGQVMDPSDTGAETNTKLQTVMHAMARQLTLLALIMCVTGALLELWKGTEWQEVILSGLGLAFATIFKELAVLIAAVLAVGAQALSQQFVYLKKLKAAENLGFVDTILTDKTGTLTESRFLWHSAYLGIEQYEIRSRVLIFRRRLDYRGFEKILKAWFFMSDIGDDLEDTAISTQREASGGTKDRNSDDDIGLTVNSSPENPAADQDDDTKDASPHIGAGADAFDRAILFALGSNVCFGGRGHPGYGLLASNSNVRKHLEEVYQAKKEATVLAETPFDPASKLASRTFESSSPVTQEHLMDSSRPLTYMKGAPDLLLRHCSYAMDNGSVLPVGKIRRKIEEQMLIAASQGFRLIGYAYKDSESSSKKTLGDREDGDGSQPLSVLDGATFLGFFSFLDPVREEASASVLKCQEAGVTVFMVTGDHIKTAVSVARQVGIIPPRKRGMSRTDMTISCAEVQLSSLQKEEQQEIVMNNRVFARATPADKLVILNTLQGTSKCVMATGDGVADAPILLQADVGVAMRKGTDVARNVATVVLMDDSFKMIPHTLAEGRRLLDNLRKALAFYLGAKAGLIFVFILGTLWDSGPLSAVQIILLELFMDLGASIAFVMEPGDGDIMKRRPRHHAERFFDCELLSWISVSALTVSVTVLVSFIMALREDPKSAQTSAFFTWLFVQVLIAFNLRTFKQPVARKGLFSNVGILVWLCATIVAWVIMCSSHLVRTNLRLVPMSGMHWLLIILISICGTFWIELAKFVVPAIPISKVVSRFKRQFKEEGDGSGSLLAGEEKVPLTLSA